MGGSLPPNILPHACARFTPSSAGRMITTGIKTAAHTTHCDKTGQMRLPALHHSAGGGVKNAPLITAAKINDPAPAPKIAPTPTEIYRHKQHSAPTHTLAIS